MPELPRSTVVAATSALMLSIALLTPTLTFRRSCCLKGFEIGIAAHIVSRSCRAPSLSLAPRLGSGVAVVLSTLAQETLRVVAIGFVNSSPNLSLECAWWYAVGIATANELYGVSEFHAHALVYRPIRSPISDTPDDASALSYDSIHEPGSLSLDDEDEDETNLDWQLDVLQQARERRQLEAVFGMPFPNIPLFILCLLRMDSLILNIGGTLLIAKQYTVGGQHLAFSFLFMCIIFGTLNLLWSRFLPRFGLHSVAYGTLFCALFVFLGALASWGVLI